MSGLVHEGWGILGSKEERDGERWGYIHSSIFGEGKMLRTKRGREDGWVGVEEGNVR